MNGFIIPEGMEFGAASAATQIEGGECGHNWNDWYHKGHIKDGSDPARANKHYEHWKEDCDLMAKMGLEIYRMGIEWARIEPAEGEFDKAVLSHYREEIHYLKKLGIKPLLTLHHFTNPMWFEEKGSFAKEENSKYYLRFVKKCLEFFGDIVSEYITINEPNVYATSSWFYGDWPPGEKSFLKTIKVMSIMSHCHIEAYKMIHSYRRNRGYHDTKVSFANHLRVFEPADKENLWHWICAKTMDWAFQGAVTLAMVTGYYRFPLLNCGKDKPGKYIDFIAINYYARSTVSGFKDGVKKGVPVNDLGWEIYARGIVECAKKQYDKWHLPIYITENGTCDNTDSFRSRYLYDHIKALCESGLPVKRYYHWCFCDNFEWIDGESSRFGLVYVDYETQRRTIKESGNFYSKMIADGGVDEETYRTYVKYQTYFTNS